MTEDGRRCYEKGLCPFHNVVQDQVNKALPRWVFISAFGTLITISILFAGWHVTSLNSLESKFQGQVFQYSLITQQNREILIELRTNQVELIKKFDRIYAGSEK